MQKLYACENYILVYKSVNIGEYIKIQDKLFNFSTILTPGIIGKEKVKNPF